MSISALIEDAVENGRLHRLLPYWPKARTVRVMYVTPEIKAYLAKDDERAGRLHADLDSFTAGDKLTVSMTPGKARDAYMGLLAPKDDGIWDIRSRDPSPGLRVLGGFARKDAFVALQLYERRILGNILSREWATAVKRTKTDWSNLFYAYKPLIGDVSEYLSNSVSIDGD